MDPKTLAVSALKALAPSWPAAGAMLSLLESAGFRPDLCEAVCKLVAQAALAAQADADQARFRAAHDALAALRQREATDRQHEISG